MTILFKFQFLIFYLHLFIPIFRKLWFCSTATKIGYSNLGTWGPGLTHFDAILEVKPSKIPLKTLVILKIIFSYIFYQSFIGNAPADYGQLQPEDLVPWELVPPSYHVYLIQGCRATLSWLFLEKKKCSKTHNWGQNLKYTMQTGTVL